MNADILRKYFGFNDPNVIENILRDPGQVERYKREYQGIINPQPAPSPTSAQLADQIIKAVEPALKEETKFAEQLFGKDNPFVFDEYAARQSIQTEYEPYYNEMLNDYIGNIGVKRESLAGDQQLLNALRTTPEGTAGETTRAYERAVANAEQGFAGRGMFFSGVKKTALGQAEVEREQGLQQTKTDIQKQQRDIFGGDVERGGLAGYTGGGGLFQGAIAEELGARETEQAKEFYTPKIMAYARRYPTEGNVLAGYVPAEYLRY